MPLFLPSLCQTKWNLMKFYWYDEIVNRIKIDDGNEIVKICVTKF